MGNRPYTAPEGIMIVLLQENDLLTGTNRADEGYDSDNDLGEI